MNSGFRLTRKNLLHLLFYSILLAAVTPIVLRQIHANDIWKALYTGRYVKFFYHFPHHSAFTYSPVNDFLIRNTYNWLGNLTLVGIHQLGGIHGLQLLRVAIAAFFVGLLHAETNFSRNPLILLILVLAVYGISQKLRLRTAIFAVPFTAVLLRFWMLHDFRNDSRYLWALPLVFLFWSNMHGSYVIGIGFFFCLLLGTGITTTNRYFSDEPVDWQTIGTLVLITLLIIGTVTFVKPHPDYKISNTLGELPFRLLTVSDDSTETSKTDRSWLESLNQRLRNTISPRRGFRANEYESPFANTQNAFVKANFLLGSILLLLLLFTRRSYVYGPLILAAILLGVTYLRSMPYITLVLGSLACSLYGEGKLPNWSESAMTKSVALLTVVTIGTSIIVVSSTGLRNLTGQYFHQFGTGKVGKFSDDIPEYALKRYPRVPVANSFNTGTFLIWKWWPYKRVFVDSKSSAYTNNFWQTMRRVGGLRILQANNVRFFIIEENNSNLKILQRHPNWWLKREHGGLYFFQYDSL